MDVMKSIIIFSIVLFITGFPMMWQLYKKIPVLVTPYIKVDFTRRMLAGWFDGGIGLILLYPAYTDKNFLIFSIIAASAYILLKDGFIEGRSIGKLVAGLMVIRLEDGKPAKLKQSIYRNILFLIPGLNIAALIFESVVIYKKEGGIRLGDKIAKTQVVMGKDSIEWVKDLLLFWHRNREIFKRTPEH